MATRRRLATRAIAAAGISLLAMPAVAAGSPPGDPGTAFWAFLKHDYATAAKYAQGWAEYGDANSEAVLGMMYVIGQGMPFLPATGLNWLFKAAKQDNDFAFAFLAEIDAGGQLFAPDKVQALSWYILATRDTAPAIFPDATVAARHQLAKQMTPEQQAQARALAAKWLTEHPLPKKR